MFLAGIDIGGVFPYYAVKIFSALIFAVGIIECFFGCKIMRFTSALWGFMSGFVLCLLFKAALSLYEYNYLEAFIVFLIGATLAFFSIHRMYFIGTLVFTAVLTYILIWFLFGNFYFAAAGSFAAAVITVFFPKAATVIFSSASGAVKISAVFSWALAFENNFAFIKYILAVILTMAGILVQLGIFPHIGRKRNEKNVFDDILCSEIRFQGMQRVYKNFCVKCGHRLKKENLRCHKCGFKN